MDASASPISVNADLKRDETDGVVRVGNVPRIPLRRSKKPRTLRLAQGVLAREDGITGLRLV